MVVFFPCGVDVRHTHTQKLTLSHTHTPSHSHAHAHAQIHAHTHTHTPNQPAPHLAPVPTTSLPRKKVKKYISSSSLTVLPSGACSRCNQRRRTLLKSENVAPIHVDGGLVHFTDHFVYLGSIISSDLADDTECGSRIAAAAGAFGYLRARIFCETLVDLEEKSAVYQTLILNLMFYGSECWTLSSHMLECLRSFHRRCVRTMCGFSLNMGVVTYSRSGRITSHAEFEKRMYMSDIATLLLRRRIQWAGHVLRMGQERLPRRMITSWIPTTRPKGQPHLTFAQGLVKDLAYVGSTQVIWECSLQTGGPGERPSTTLVLMG